MAIPTRVAALVTLSLLFCSAGGCRKAADSNPPAPKNNAAATSAPDTQRNPASPVADSKAAGANSKAAGGAMEKTADAPKQIGAAGASETVFLDQPRETTAPSAEPGAATAAPATSSSPPGASEALVRAAELFNQDITEGAEFSGSLVRAKAIIPEIPVAVGDQPAKWNKIKLNQAGNGFDAIRFTSPLDKTADLIWALVMSEDLGMRSWYITPARGHINGFKGFNLTDELDLDEIGFTTQTKVLFQDLCGGEILPKSEYFIWISFVHQLPREVYIKLKLIPARRDLLDRNNKRSPMEMVTTLNVKLPPPPAGKDIVRHATDLAESGGVDEAIKELEERIKTDGPNASRAVRFARIHIMFIRAHDWSLKPETLDKAYKSFIETAPLMREFKQDVGSLSFPERKTYGNLLFFEACALVNAGQNPKAIDSVREAMENRIDPRDFPDEPIGNALRQLPEYRALLETLDKRR